MSREKEHLVVERANGLKTWEFWDVVVTGLYCESWNASRNALELLTNPSCLMHWAQLQERHHPEGLYWKHHPYATSTGLQPLDSIHRFIYGFLKFTKTYSCIPKIFAFFPPIVLYVILETYLVIPNMHLLNKRKRMNLMPFHHLLQCQHSND